MKNYHFLIMLLRRHPFSAHGASVFFISFEGNQVTRFSYNKKGAKAPIN